MPRPSSIGQVLRWRDTIEGVAARVEEIFAPWLGTPYAADQCAQGVGVDCVRLFVAGYAELARIKRPALEHLPQDVCLHAPQTSRAFMHTAMKELAPADRIAGDEIEPGDVVVTGPVDGGPGHVMIAAGQPNTLIHASGNRVSRHGVALPAAHRVFAIFRSPVKAEWIT